MNIIFHPSKWLPCWLAGSLCVYIYESFTFESLTKTNPLHTSSPEKPPTTSSISLRYKSRDQLEHKEEQDLLKSRPNEKKNKKKNDTKLLANCYTNATTMCNPNTDPSSHSSPPTLSSSSSSSINPAQYLKNLKNSMDYYLPCPTPATSDHHPNPDLHRWPSTSEAVDEIKAIGKISGPTVMTGLLWYSRAMVSMLFLGYLGELELAGGSLAIGFANITGYSVISGLAMGMEPICGQAYGAKQMKLLGLTLQRTVLLLFSISIPISFLWLNMKSILTLCGQDESITSMAHVFIIFSIPDLFLLSLLHPLRIYLRTQNITLPITYCSAISVLIHVPLNFILVVYFKMGIAGVATAMIWTNANLFLLLFCFVLVSGVYKPSWVAPSMDCVRGWTSLLSLAIPTCASVCLEWWWYEFMILLCGLLVNPKATISSMGILIQTTSLVYVFPSALSLGVSTRVGNELGANRPARARFCMIVSLACSVLLGLVAMTFTTLMRHRWGRLFTNDPEILKLTAIALPITGLCELGNCPQTTGCGVLRGCARPTVGANINLGSFYLVGMPVGILMGFVAKLGFAGLWLGLLAAQASCALLMFIVVIRTDWTVQAERASELTKSPTSPSSLPISAPSTKAAEPIKVEVGKNNKTHDCINHEAIFFIGDEFLKSSLSPNESDSLLASQEAIP